MTTHRNIFKWACDLGTTPNLTAALLCVTDDIKSMNVNGYSWIHPVVPVLLEFIVVQWSETQYVNNCD